MASTISVTYTFGPQAGPIPTAELDTNFANITQGINNLFQNGLVMGPPLSGTALVVSGGPNADAITAVGSSTVGASYGLLITAGTNASDLAFYVANQPDNLSFFRIQGDGSVVVGNTGTIGKGAGTLNAQNGVSVGGVPLALSGVNILTKAATTARSSTTVLTNDPDLTFAIPSAGTYEIKVRASMFQGGAGAAGSNVNLNFSGTITSSMAIFNVSGASGALPLSPTGANVSATVNNALVTVTQLNTFSNGDGLQIDAILVAGGAGTVAVAWAQNTSSVTTTSMQAQSFMTVMRIA